MSNPYLGEIRIFAGNFAPVGWAFCDGQLLNISSHSALFSLFGTFYGGDGRNTFGLPDLRGRLPVHMGSGPGLAPRNIGSKSGSENETVTNNQLPSHTHEMKASSALATNRSPVGAAYAHTANADAYRDTATSPTTMATAAVSGSAGGGQSHTNLMPFLCLHFIVALVGVFPSRS